VNVTGTESCLMMDSCSRNIGPSASATREFVVTCQRPLVFYVCP
jgi:hypothetical protein